MYIDKIVSDEFSALRLQNMKTIEEFFSLSGEGFLDAWKLHHDQAYTGIYTTENAVPEGVGGGIHNIKEWYAYNVRYFPNWKINHFTIYQQEDPRKFFVQCEAEGDIDLPDYDKLHYKSIFFNDLEMRDGKISVHWVHFSPANLLLEMGLMPQD